MKLLAALALSCSLLGAAAAQTPPAGTTAQAQVPAAAVVASSSPAGAATLAENSKILLNAGDLKTALAEAEAAVAAGGGAAAFAARAEARLALGRPLDEAISDYAEAARLDPRYGEKYRGLLAQLQSESSPGKGKDAKSQGAGGIAIHFVLGLAAAGILLLVFGLIFLRRKKSMGKSASEL